MSQFCPHCGQGFKRLASHEYRCKQKTPVHSALPSSLNNPSHNFTSTPSSSFNRGEATGGFPSLPRPANISHSPFQSQTQVTQRCPDCGGTFKNLANHKICHGRGSENKGVQQRPLENQKCADCGQSFKNLANHKICHRRKLEAKPLKPADVQTRPITPKDVKTRPIEPANVQLQICPDCGKGFKNLANHKICYGRKLEVKPRKPEDVQTSPIEPANVQLQICPDCGKGFKNLANHKICYGRKLEVKPKKPADVQTSPIEPANVQLQICPDCGKGFKNLANHKICHGRKHETKPVKPEKVIMQACPDCGKCFKNLANHKICNGGKSKTKAVKTVSVKMQICPDCGKHFKNLARHKICHGPEARISKVENSDPENSLLPLMTPPPSPGTYDIGRFPPSPEGGSDDYTGPLPGTPPYTPPVLLHQYPTDDSDEEEEGVWVDDESDEVGVCLPHESADEIEEENEGEAVEVEEEEEEEGDEDNPQEEFDSDQSGDFRKEEASEEEREDRHDESFEEEVGEYRHQREDNEEESDDGDEEDEENISDEEEGALGTDEEDDDETEEQRSLRDFPPDRDQHEPTWSKGRMLRDLNGDLNDEEALAIALALSVDQEHSGELKTLPDHESRNLGDSQYPQDADHIPSHTPKPAPIPIDLKDVPRVVFDMETTGFGVDAHIIQLAAASHDSNIFSTYVLPGKPITKGAERVTGISVREGNMFKFDNPVPAVAIRRAITMFFDFLRSLNYPAVLVGHNSRLFDSRILINTIKKCDMMDDCRKYIAGFVDTLPLLKELYPNRKNYKQLDLYVDVMGGAYNAHDAVSDVVALRDLLSVSSVSQDLWEKFSFSVHYVTDILEYLQMKKVLMDTLYPLTGTVSEGMRAKIAGSGLGLQHLRLAFLRGGSRGLADLLREDIGGKPRISKSKRFISIVCDFFARHHDL